MKPKEYNNTTHVNAVNDSNPNVVDYINGHLSGEQLTCFETQLSNDDHLAKELQQAQDWQQKMQSSHNDAPMPQFSSIEGKLKAPKWNLQYGLSTAAAIALVAILYIATPETQNNEFETLTSPNATYGQAMMQMVISDDANIADIVSSYNLHVIKQYPNQQIIEVKLDANFTQNASAIEADKRVIFLKKLGEQK